MKFSNLIIASLAITTEAGKNKEQKLKDKKSRLLRNLRKEAPVKLNNPEDKVVIYDDDALGMQCLTGSGEFESLNENQKGQLNHEQARIFICQHWLNEFDKIELFLMETFGIGLLTDETIDYDTGAGISSDVGNDNSWNVIDGPNAKNTVAAFKTICEDLIPDDHPKLGFHCRGGFVTKSGEVLSHTECRELYDRKNIKQSKKRCRREIKNRAGNKGKWL